MFQASILAAMAALTAIDRFTKRWAVETIKDGDPKKFFFGLFQFRYVENSGAAFGSFSGDVKILTAVTAIVIVVCLIVLFFGKLKSKFVRGCLALVAAGGLGNFIDRVLYGFVVDFVEPLFIDFAVYNFADCCVTVGAVALISREIYELIKAEKGKRKKNDGTDRRYRI